MSENDKLFHLTIREAGDLLRARKLSPVELTQAFLARIDAVDGRLESFATLVHD